MTIPSACAGGRRQRSAKARNRGKSGDERTIWLYGDLSTAMRIVAVGRRGQSDCRALAFKAASLSAGGESGVTRKSVGRTKWPSLATIASRSPELWTVCGLAHPRRGGSAGAEGECARCHTALRCNAEIAYERAIVTCLFPSDREAFCWTGGAQRRLVFGRAALPTH